MAQAQTVWDGGGSDANVNTAANWNNDTLPAAFAGTAASAVTFGTGGSSCLFNVEAFFTGVLLNRATAFSLGSAGSGSLVLRSVNSSNGVYNLTMSVAAGAPQTIHAPLKVDTNHTDANKLLSIRNNNGLAGRVLDINGAVSRSAAGTADFAIRYEGVAGSVTRFDGPVSQLAAVQQSTGAAWAGDLIFGGVQASGADITIAATSPAPTPTARLFLGETPADVQTWGNLALNHTMKLVIGGQITAGTLSVGGNATASTTRIVGNSASAASLSLIGGNITSAVTLGGNGVNENRLGLVKTGTGTLTLDGVHSYTGSTTVQGGTLNLRGRLASSVAVNAGAKLTVNDGAVTGGLTVAAGGVLVVDDAGFSSQKAVSLAGSAQFSVNRITGLQSGRLTVGGALTMGGTLVVLNSGPALKAGDRFQLFRATARAGSLTQFSLPSLEYKLQWDTSPLAVDGSIRVVAATATDPVFITLTPGTFHQQFKGIGGNFCQGEQGVLIAYNRFDEMFSADGLNLSFIRLGNTYEITEPRFAGMAEDNITTTKEFRARQPYGSIMMTAWSPPSGLKNTASPYEGTLAKTAGGQYRYADYAAWWTRSLQYYSAANALPDCVSIQNEPDFTPSGTTGMAALNQLQAQYPYWEIDKFMTELNPFDQFETYDAAQPGWMQLAVTPPSNR